MSETSSSSPTPDLSPSPPASPSPSPAAPAKKDAQAPKPRRWRRRLVRIGIVILILLAVGRLSFGLLARWALNRSARFFQLTCTYDRFDMKLIGGDVNLWNVVIAPAEGGSPFARVDYCNLRINPLQLLRGRLDVRRAVADGVELNLQRRADGTMPLLTRFASNTPTPPKSKPPQPLDLAPPLRIEALRLQHVIAHVQDLAVSPPLDATLDVNVRLSDLAAPDRPAQFQITAMSSSLLDQLIAEGAGSSNPNTLSADARVIVRGLHPQPAAGYLLAMGIKPVAQSISLATVAHLNVSVAPGSTDALAARASLDHVICTADGQTALNLHDAQVVVDSLSPTAIRVAKISLNGIEANAARSPQGALRAGGFELASAAPAASQANDPPPEAQPAAPAPVISLAEFRVTDVKATVRDQSVSPPADLQIQIPSVTVKNLSTDVATTQPDSLIDATVQVPGVSRSVHLSGTARSVGDHRALKLDVGAEGIRPDALRPYLDAIGVRCDLNDAKLTAQLDGSLTSPPGGGVQSDLLFHNVRLTDKHDLFTFEQVKVAGLTIDPTVSHVGVDDIDVSGPQLAIHRDAEGSFGTMGFRFNPAWRKAGPSAPTQSGPAEAKASPKSASTSQPASPAIDLRHLSWHGVNIQLSDDTIKPPTRIKLADAGVEVSDLHFEPTPTTQPASPGKFRAWLKSPELVENLEASGTLAPTGDHIVADVDVSGTGIHLVAAAPYVRDFGVEPVLHNGTLRLHAHVDAKSSSDALSASAAIRDLSLSDDGKESLGLGGAQIDNLTQRPEAISVDAITIDKPQVLIDRDKDRLLSAAGFKMLQKESAPPSLQSAAIQAAATQAVATQPAAPAKPTAIVLKHLAVRDANLQWADRAVQPEARLTTIANVDLSDFDFSAGAAPAKLRVNARAEGVFDEATIQGTVAASPDSAAAALEIAARGIRPTALAPYFPPGVQSELKDGRFHVRLDASVADDKGVGKGSLAVTNLNYQDGENGSPFVKFDSASFVASRIELPKAVAIEEISLKGLEVDAQKSQDGRTLAIGLSFGNPVPAREGEAPAEPRSPSQTPTSAPTTTRPTGRPALSASQLAQAKLRPEPLVTVENLDVNVKRISYADHSQAGSVPLTLDDFRLHNLKRIELLGQDPISRPPVELELSGAAHPLADVIDAKLSASPFATKPTLSLDLSVNGIKGDGLTALRPNLKTALDGSQLADGQFRAKLEGQADIFRPTPLEWDLSHPFDLSFVMRDIEFRQAADGPVLAGLEEVRSDAIHVDPAKQMVTVRSLEITNPALWASHEQDGLHALGFVLKPPATQPATAPAETAPAVAATAPATAPAVASGSSSEVRIDRLLVSGINVLYADHTVDPNLVVPLNGLDLEVRGLSSKATSQDIPIRFSAVLNGGKVPLPRRQQVGALTGAASDMRTLAEGKQVATTQPIEQRELFSQIEADGVISLYPAPRGWAKASVSGLELVALKGMAKEYKIVLEEGTFDVTEDVRLPGDGSMITRTRPVFTDLSVTEPPDGPIFRYLHLPAPLDVVLVAVRDQDGSIAVPFDVPVKNGHINGSDVTAAAIQALGAILVRAIAAAPAKAAGTVTGAVTDVVGAFVPGLGGKPQPNQPVAIPFAPGDASLEAAQLGDLQPVIDRMKQDDSLELTLRHDLGGGDVARAAQRANPSPQEAQALAEQLRRKRADLVALAAETEGQTRAQLAIAPASASASSVERLRLIRREIAATDDALDQLYDLLRPGAEHQTGRRTRQACLAIGQARLKAIQDAVTASGIKDADKRIRVIRSQFNVVQPQGGHVVLSLVKKKS